MTWSVSRGVAGMQHEQDKTPRNGPLVARESLVESQKQVEVDSVQISPGITVVWHEVRVAAPLTDEL